MTAETDPAEVAKFKAGAEVHRQRELEENGKQLTVEQAEEEFAALLTNLKDKPLEIFALRIGLEDLEQRVEALELAQAPPLQGN